jgi:hypothetical protein
MLIGLIGGDEVGYKLDYYIRETRLARDDSSGQAKRLFTRKTTVFGALP